jgi:hypothetical protein
MTTIVPLRVDGLPPQHTPSKDACVTDSWKRYEECMASIHAFEREVTIRESEVWIRDLCFGSRAEPMIRVPAELDWQAVTSTVEHARSLVTSIRKSLSASIATSASVMERFRREGGDEEGLRRITARTNALEDLASELERAAALAPVEYHPAVLAGWLEILSERLEPGSGYVTVVVCTEYVL